jgi:hypothetical protein
VIHASGSYAALDITRQLLAKNEILGADRLGRAQERDDEPQHVRGYSDDRSRKLQHALIMPEAVGGCRRWMPTQTRRELLRTTVGQGSPNEPAALNEVPAHVADGKVSDPSPLRVRNTIDEHGYGAASNGIPHILPVGYCELVSFIGTVETERLLRLAN